MVIYEKLNNFFEKLDLDLVIILKKNIFRYKIKPIDGCLFQKMYISRNLLEKKASHCS